MEALRGRRVTVVEVGPRDGLQNEKVVISTDDKVSFVNALSAAALPVIEVSAFVNPARVPQMSDGAELFARIARRAGTRYTALVPNLVGLERAAAAGLDEIAIFAAASDAFSRANINQSVDDSLVAYGVVCERASRLGMRVRGYLSTAFGCPYEGAVPEARVADLASRLLGMGVFEVAISDTIGVAHPGQVRSVLDAIGQRMALDRVALHFHDTRGTALANVLAGLTMGITTFDASAGGLGGCPFAPGAAGNLATEDLIYMLDGLGIETGVALEAVTRASSLIGARLDHPLPSRYVQAERATLRRE
ncbi:MAG TPA: hydroxymethylglutaryl-CoA lyase [Vicinamibacterales bacterium]|nr:hydroxymethylglutaryl-CoA lyase [Vicinamibacterales bacterium]